LCNAKTGEIVGMEIFDRISTVIDSELYMRASQQQFDKWCHSLGDDNDNGKIKFFIYTIYFI